MEIAEILGHELKRTHSESEGRLSITHRISPSPLTHDLGFLGTLASHAVPITPSDKSEILVITSQLAPPPTADSPSPAAPSTILLAVGSADLVTKFTNELKVQELFKGRVKGGGKGGRWMGKVDGVCAENEKEVMEDLLKKLRG